MRIGLGDLPPDAQQAYDNAQTPQAQQANAQTTYNAMQKVANGQSLSRDDTIAVAATVLVLAGQPEAAAALVVIYEFSIVIAKALFGGQAHGVDMCTPDQPPPSGPDDPRWVHATLYADHVETMTQCQYPPCSTTLPVTTAPGTFEAFAGPVILQNWEQWVNCRNVVAFDVLITQLAAAWNQAHPGGGQQMYTPGVGTSYVAYAMKSAANGGPMGSISVANGPLAPQENWATWLEENGGIILPGPPPAKSTPMSTGAKVAIGTGVVVGGGLATAAIVAYVKKQSLQTTLEQAWKAIKRRL